MKELISVIVPVYNVERYLAKCIESIINQTYDNVEIILVDDGSTDKSGDICDKYANQDTRIKVIHKTNGGLSDARNTGIEVAKGEYFSFIDSDDYIAENMIECLYRRLISDGSDMSMCNCCHVDEEGNISQLKETSMVSDTVLKKEDIFIEFIGTRHTVLSIACSKLYKRKLFVDIRYSVGKIHEDEFVAHKILNKCSLISCVKEPMYFYLQRKGSIVHSEYSLKKLDAAEALLDRVEYSLNNKIDIWAEKSFKEVVGYLVLGYKKLDFSDEKVKCRMNELKSYFDRLYPKAIKTVKSYIWKCLILLFRTSPKLYMVLHNSRKR